MKILITGVAGFIGSNLARRLLNENKTGANHFDVIGIDNLAFGLKDNIPYGVEFYEVDVRKANIYKVFKGVDLVFHLAAKNCINECQMDPAETVEINVAGTVNIFEAARKTKVKKVICAESSALYEGTEVFPTPESDVRPLSFYSLSKFAGRKFAQAFQRFYGIKFTALRYFCVYGPVQDYRRTIPPVMPAFIIKLLKNESPIIYGTGYKRRDFIYVDDINDFHLKCIEDSRTDNMTFNLGSGTNHSVLEIYNIISDLLGKKEEPIFKPDLPGEAKITLADITEAKRLGWKPKIDIKTGLLKAIEYIKNEMNAGRI